MTSVVTGQPLPPGPASAINSPVQVIVNGATTEVIGAVGHPGARNGYQVNFRLRANLAKGSAMILMDSAWIASAQVTVPVQ